jgi:hypothetical protein
MSIISCPECGKKISSRAAICSYCGFQLGEVSQQDLEVYQARRLREGIYHLNMASYLAIALFVAGFGWYWWDSRGFVEAPTAGPFVLMGIAAVGYLVVRALLFRRRQQRKALIRAAGANRDLRRNL